jgi:hypothetical protein
MKPLGNGSTRVDVHTQDMGGWVRVFTDPGRLSDELPLYLSHALTEWFRQRPQLRVRFAVPVSKDGETVELHAWYDMVLFPDVSAKEPTPK